MSLPTKRPTKRSVAPGALLTSVATNDLEILASETVAGIEVKRLPLLKKRLTVLCYL